MSHSYAERDPVELLADEFAARCRRGECPSVAEYATRHPAFAQQIESLFPAVAMMEQLRLQEMTRRKAAARRSWSVAAPQHLGDFEIIREIGRGGMGIVYEAEQRSLARRVAVKVLPTYVLLLDSHLKRFQREAQTAARLRHTNIVPVFGVGEHEGLHYYAMPLVRGVGLDEILDELRKAVALSEDDVDPLGPVSVARQSILGLARTLTAEKFAGTESAAVESCPRVPQDSEVWRTVAQIGVQAAQALDYAHRQGTLHRDIKPSNLLIDGEGVVCVADFGLARAMDLPDTSPSGEVVGTLRYMAPEQLRGAADPRSDVYSLGLTLYELLTLRPALYQDRQHEVAIANATTNVGRALLPVTAKTGKNAPPTVPEPLPPRKIDPAIPRDLEAIVLKCLAHEPAQRYSTAASLEADLRRFLDDKPIRARRISWTGRTWRWCRRNPALAAVSALAAILFIVVGVTASLGSVKTRRAYAAATISLGRAEATSQLALEALEDIYLQLSPERVWISSDSEPGGDACPCVGFRSTAAGTASGARPLVPVRVSKETASLLQNLLVFYDRLAEQVPSDSRVMFESAIASRRVGDIRQRLGQLDQAEQEYARAVEKFKALNAQPGADVAVRGELARTYNELGNVRSAKFESARACEAHRQALVVLGSSEQTADLPSEYQYELARTLYFLASKRSSAGNGHGDDAWEGIATVGPHRARSDKYRQQAIGILDQLARENPDAADCRFLLALCHRPAAIGPVPFERSSDRESRKRAISILEELKARYPGVVDYRYELAATYAWVPVGLYPWQRPAAVPEDVERNLRKALDESRWLVTHNPTIPDYARVQTVILAKLGTVCWRSQRLAEAEDFFQEALRTQDSMIAEFPDLPAHNRLVQEFIRLRLGELRDERHVHRPEDARGSARQGLVGEVRGRDDGRDRPPPELRHSHRGDSGAAWQDRGLLGQPHRSQSPGDRTGDLVGQGYVATSPPAGSSSNSLKSAGNAAQDAW